MRKLLLPILVPLALVAGCADNQESLIVLDAPAWKDGECAVDPAADAFLPFGVLDLSPEQPSSYVMPAILLNNTRTQQTNKTNSGIVSNEFQLTGADVTITSEQAPEMLTGIDKSDLSFNSPLPTVSLKPQQTTGVVVEVIPAVVAKGFKANLDKGAVVTVVASVKFRASRSGNEIGKVGGIEAREFEFPIKLCDGCLKTCADCDGSECPLNLKQNDWTGGVCGNWQDLPVVPIVCADNAGN